MLYTNEKGACFTSKTCVPNDSGIAHTLTYMYACVYFTYTYIQICIYTHMHIQMYICITNTKPKKIEV
jgi:hypothetical protein